jgi:DNA polymerase-1
LLNEHGTLEGIYDHLDQIPARFRSKLEAGRDQAQLSQHLSRIVTDVEVPFDLETCRWKGYDNERVTELFRTLEFRSLLDRLPEAKPRGVQQLNMFAAAPAEPPREVAPEAIIDDAPKLEGLLRRLAECDEVAIDVETTSTDAMQAALVGIALAFSDGDGVYLPLGHRLEFAGGPQLPAGNALAALTPALRRPSLAKIGHNLKYDYTVLTRHGLHPTPLSFDTMIAEWLWTRGRTTSG